MRQRLDLPRETIIKRFLAGEKLVHLSREYGCSRFTIKDIVIAGVSPAERERLFPPRAKVTKELIVADVQRVAAELGKAPTMAEYTDKGRWSAHYAMEVGGTWQWNALLKASGIEPVNIKARHATREKNSVLVDTARQLGSVRALAEYLGINYCQLNELADGNYRQRPSREAFLRGRTWQRAEERLLALCGKGWPEVFPDLFPDPEMEPLPNGSYQADQEDRVFLHELTAILVDLIRELPVRQQQVIRMRFGLTDDGRAWTLHEIGEKFNLTREAIRRIEVRALATLKRSWLLVLAIGGKAR